MTSNPPMQSPEDFLALLQEGDRWMEVVNGRLIRLSPPDEAHGNLVRNLSKALANALRAQRQLFPCFELGLILSRHPLVIRSPAICLFRTADGLEPLDELVTDRMPELIIEVASSNDRRDAMSDRLHGYQSRGIPHVWVFDPESLHAHVFSPRETPRTLKENETLSLPELFPQMNLLVGDLFLDPSWARR